jgi:hypothetical protein
MTMRNDHFDIAWELADDEIGMEQEEESAGRSYGTIRYLAGQIAEQAKPIWHQGDGHGGVVISVLLSEVRARGLYTISEDALCRMGGEGSAGALRRAVLERDAYRCQICGDWHDLTIDHVYPRSKGGQTVLENLQTLCRSCNSRKGTSVAA